MLTIALLALSIVVIVFALEILDAVYNATLIGQAKAWEPEPKGWWAVIGGLASLVVLAPMGLLGRLALWFHELAHATFQLFSGLKPRVVMCTGGGYAEGSWWSSNPLYLIPLFCLKTVWDVLISMAPLILGSILLAGFVYYWTPLHETGDVSAQISAVITAADPELSTAMPRALYDTGVMWVSAILSAPVWKMVLIFLVCAALAGSLTPSSGDFISASYSLVGLIGAIVYAGFAFARFDGSTAFLLGPAAAAFVVYIVGLKQAEHRMFGLQWTFGTFAGWLLVFFILSLTPVMDSPVSDMKFGLSATLLILAFSATLYLFFVGLLLALAIVTGRFKALWYAAKALPGELKGVFTGIAICADKKMMFQDACDYCGCTLDEFETGGCQGKDLKKQKRTGGWLGGIKDIQEQLDKKEKQRSGAAATAAKAAMMGGAER